MRACVFGLVFGSLAAACSLGALDGFSDGPPDATPDADGGTDAPASTEAAAEASTEASTDASSASFCTTVTPAPALCADFDDGKLPLALASGAAGMSTATIEPDGASGTPGLRFLVPGTAQATDAACLRISIPVGRASITVDLDATVRQIGVDEFDVLVVSGSGHEIGFRIAALGQLEIEEDDGTNTYFPSTKRLDATFHHLRFVVSKTANGAQSELFVDGEPAISRLVPGLTIDQAKVLEIGDCTINASRSWDVMIDNLVVDLK